MENNSNDDQTKKFLALLFSDFFKSSTGFIEVRCLRDNLPSKQYFYSSIDDLLCGRIMFEKHNQQGWNIHVGAAPRMERRGKKESVRAITNLWVDLDGKNFEGGKTEALQKILTFPLSPTIIKDTGNGYHGHWILSPITLVEEYGVEKLEGVLRGIAKALNGDSVCDLSRVMRLPGFFNMKDVSDPKPCFLLPEYYFPDRAYRFEEFEKFALVGGIQEINEVRLGIVSEIIPPRFFELLKTDPQLNATWEKKREMPNDNTRSGYDMSLACQLARLDFSNEEIAAVLKQYPHGKCADATDAYLQITIWKARALSQNLEEPKERKNTTNDQKQGDVFLRLVIENLEIKFFHNDTGVPYARVPIGDHLEVWPLGDRTFKRWLAKLFWDKYRKAPNAEILKNVLITLEGKAIFEGEEILLHNRVTWHEGKIWYDLADAEWRTVCVSKDGWLIPDERPILFRRYNHQLPQVEPAHGDAKKLLHFININDERQKFLLLVWVISCFIPGFPHPIPNIYGQHGSAKSCLCRILRKIIDPSSVELLSFQKDIREFVQLISHHWCPFFDNVSVMPSGVSDALCKAVTGDGFSKRELYSDDDDIIYNFKRCIGINGINLVASKPDLLDRSILFELERVPEGQKKQESAVFSEFESVRPTILGGIFDTIAKAIKIKPTIEFSSLPRMADFAAWGCAITEALGHKKEDFLAAYYHNIGRQNEEVLNESLVATATRIFMEDKECWEGTPSELLEQMTITAKTLNIDTDHEREWPKAANTLSKRLNELKTNLETAGLKVKRYEKDKKRMIVIEKILENIVSIVEPPDTPIVGVGFGDNGGDDKSSPASEPSPQNLLPDKQNDDGDDRDGIIG